MIKGSFKSPVDIFRKPNFRTANRPRSPSPKRSDYREVAKTKDTKTSRCTYIHPATNRRCRYKLGLYPEYCEMHTILINNVFIDKSNIPFAGNGLFAGPYGFKKGDVIGKYSYKWNKVPEDVFEKRCKSEKCRDYLLCEHGSDPKRSCWDGYDIRSTLMRNANDAHGSIYRNSAFFEQRGPDVFVVASRNIRPGKEIFLYYGKHYF
jgi:hypothetical protein